MFGRLVVLVVLVDYGLFVEWLVDEVSMLVGDQELVQGILVY